MLTFEQIKELIDLVATHRLSGIELERSGFRFQIDGYKAAPSGDAPVVTTVSEVAAPPAPAAATAAATAVPEAPSPSQPAVEEPADTHIVSSPIVGTFYRSPNPEASPFVDIGSRVKQGQVLCIVEAMKLMNEIEADANGIVVEVYPKNGQPVEYGEPLFAIKAD